MGHKKYLLGLDLGSSSVKASLVEANSGKVAASCFRPAEEMPIESPQPEWAEQNPQMWWDYTVEAIRHLLKVVPDAPSEIEAIGISYQMHGLVLLDKSGRVIRPSIIWCDSRAIKTGDSLNNSLGQKFCQRHLLNSPGNFTASKLAWVKKNEPEVYSVVHKFMLPGDYLAYKLSGDMNITPSGLSEGILWDFEEWSPSKAFLTEMDIPPSMLPKEVPSFGWQCAVSSEAATETGIMSGTPITYRSGDQPNNALSLKVFQSGQVAATAGTSGVIYGVSDKLISDESSRINTFLHPSADSEKLVGVLLCINGTGSAYRWVRQLSGTSDYSHMNELAKTISPGSEGLRFFPFGNGAERMLKNQQPGSLIQGISFNRHTTGHLFRAAQEGIAYSFRYGFDLMEGLGTTTGVIRAARANMFLSPLFCHLFTNLTGVELEIYDTDGAKGAAMAAGVGAGLYHTMEEIPLHRMETYSPDKKSVEQYNSYYNQWKESLIAQLQYYDNDTTRIF
jgi:xylulokinase